MSNQIDKLIAELTDDPLVRGYAGMTDQQVVDSMNAIDRPADVTIERILRFVLLENTHSTDGNDTQDRAIWTRLKDVVALAVTPSGADPNPWGSAAVGTVTEIQQVKTAQLLDFFTLSAQGGLQVDLSDSNFAVYLAGAEASGCLSAAQETTLKALGDNLQSRATELGMRRVKPGHVAEARS